MRRQRRDETPVSEDGLHHRAGRKEVQTQETRGKWLCAFKRTDDPREMWPGEMGVN